MNIAMSSSSWDVPPTTPTINQETVHVWRATLDMDSSRITWFAKMLSADERERATRFKFQRDRERYIASHGLLRFILGKYRKLDPACLRFRYNRYGKPSLADEPSHGMRFSISHSGGLALFAVAQGREVGVDVELFRISIAHEQIANTIFSAGEVAKLRSLPCEVKPKAFFTYWTLKEAYIKARGQGVSFPLNDFEISFSWHEQFAKLILYGQRQEASPWSLRKLAPGGDYFAALAVEGQGWTLHCWQWC